MGANASTLEIPGGGTDGYQVIKVQDNSPGQHAGLEAFFDFIVAVNGQRLVCGRGKEGEGGRGNEEWKVRWQFGWGENLKSDLGPLVLPTHLLAPRVCAECGRRHAEERVRGQPGQAAEDSRVQQQGPVRAR